MRDGLAREFPEAGRASSWARDRFAGGPALWSEPVLWATISAIGAGFLVGAVALALVSLTSEALQALRSPSPQPFTLFPLVTIAGIAAAAAVALRAGGPLALALDVAYVALGIALAIPSRSFFCERSGGVSPFPGPDQCTAAGFFASLWPELIGIGVGIALARALISRGEGINSLLRVAGGLAIALFVVTQASSASIAQAGYVAEPSGALTSGLTFAAGTVAAAVVAGVVAAHVPRGVWSASAVALVWLVPWFAGQVPYALRILTGPIATENFAPILLGIVIKPIAAAFLVLSAVVTSRARFIPRDVA